MDELRKTKYDEQGEHFFERGKEYGRLPWRDWMRQNLPRGKDGLSVEDLDAIVTVFGPLSPDIPKFMLVEFKLWGTQLDYSQLKTLQLLNALLRKADPQRHQYRGVFVIEWPRPEMDPDWVRLNYQHPLKLDQLKEFFLFRRHVKSYFDLTPERTP